MHYFINLCRCCLSTAIPTNDYLCKKARERVNFTNYFEAILEIFPDVQLKRMLPFKLCHNCQRLISEATKMKQYLNYQMENEQSQKLLLKDSSCSGCLETCMYLFDKITRSTASDVCNKTTLEVLKESFPHIQFQPHISYKYCNTCSSYVKSVHLIRELLTKNNSVYENYCSVLTGHSSNVAFSSLVIIPAIKTDDISNVEKNEIVSMKEEIDMGIECVFIKVEKEDNFSNNLTNSSGEDIGGDTDQQQIHDKHEELHTEENGYKCKECQKSFKFAYNLKEHSSIHTGGRPYKCNYCQKAFRLLSNFRVHERIHSGEKPYVCDYCKKLFSRSKDLKIHKRIHTGEKPYLCNYCHKAFSQKSHLISHIRTHTGEKPYLCKHCQKTFSEKTHLAIHERIHTGEKPYKCNGCSKSFAEISNLRKHERIHTGEKPYKCDECEKGFSLKRYLTLHKLNHTGEKPHKCNECNKSFTEISNLKQHERIHTGEKPYVCNECQKTFSRNSNLKSHIRKHTKVQRLKSNII